MKRVVVVGEPMVELLEEAPGVFRQGFGGDALNTAVYLAREAPEMRIGLVSAVGDDPFSDALFETCRVEGVNPDYLRRVVGTSMGLYLVSVDASGERSFRYWRSDSPFRRMLDIDDPFPDPATVGLLWFSGVGLAVLHERGRRRLLDEAAEVGRRGGRVAFDPNHRPSLWEDLQSARAWTARAARVADILLASVDDGRLLTGATSVRDVAAAFRTMGAQEVVVTDGSNPCIVATSDGVEQVDAVRTTQIVDTTAAGDAFDAGYLAARLHGVDIPGCAASGHQLAASVLCQRGALTPRRPNR